MDKTGATVLLLHGSRVDRKTTSVNSMGTVSNGVKGNSEFIVQPMKTVPLIR